MEKIYEWVSPQWKSFTGEVGVIYYFIEVTKVPIVKDYFVNKIPPKIKEGVQQKGLTIIPTEIYLKDGLAKVHISLAKGKKLYDKRREIAKRDVQRDMDRQYKQ